MNAFSLRALFISGLASFAVVATEAMDVREELARAREKLNALTGYDATRLVRMSDDYREKVFSDIRCAEARCQRLEWAVHAGRFSRADDELSRKKEELARVQDKLSGLSGYDATRLARTSDDYREKVFSDIRCAEARCQRLEREVRYLGGQ